jgi:hypothetical protein
MADPSAKLLQPGFGGAIQLSLSNGQTSLAIDMSRVDCFAVVLTSETGVNSTQVQQSFDKGVNWANLGSALASAGNTLKQDITDGPHGLIRVVQTGAGSGVVTIVGWPTKVTN